MSSYFPSVPNPSAESPAPLPLSNPPSPFEALDEGAVAEEEEERKALQGV